jgi:hypothetical protein
MTDRPQPFDLTPAKLHGFESYDALARWLTEEIDGALAVRTHLDAQLDYWHRIYEQDRTRLVTHRPRPEGADLTSPLGTQYVDALHARAMATIFGVEPIWTVEGWAESADRAPLVEEFHQWAAEDERVQSYVDRAIQNSWIDAVGILECYEETDLRPVRKTIWAQLETAPDAQGQPRPVFGLDTRPIFTRDAQGRLVEVPAPAEGAPVEIGIAQVEVDQLEPVRVGPGYSVIDHAEFLVLPGHARDKRDIWGYAKRFYRRHSDLTAPTQAGRYDPAACAVIGESDERETTIDDARRGVTVATQDGVTAEKELWEVAFLRDLDGTGARWWVATISARYQILLRLKYDDLGTQIGFGRFVRFVPMPRKNSVDGLSVIGHKIITLIEEHTAIRNMRADRSALAAAAPIKVLQGALYDPEEHPIGAGTVIYCRDMREIEPMIIPDVPASVGQWEQSVFDACERSMGVTDIASGVTAQQDRTLGERQMQAGYSEVRMNLVVRRLQEAMEELGQIRHIIWTRVLREQGSVVLPQTAMVGLEARGQDVTMLPGGRMTAEMMAGKFKFKPRGSVETADPSRLRADFAQMLQALASVAQMNPLVAAAWQTPQAAKALNAQIVNLFKFPAKQAVLGMPGQLAGGTSGLLQDPQIQALLQQVGGGGQALGTPGAGGPAGMGAAGPPAAPPPQGMMS